MLHLEVSNMDRLVLPVLVRIEVVLCICGYYHQSVIFSVSVLEPWR